MSAFKLYYKLVSYIRIWRLIIEIKQNNNYLIYFEKVGDTKMHASKQKITLFKGIISNEEIDEEDIKKFLKWGKGDIEQALNYYYTHLEKGKLKKTKLQQKKSKNQSDQENSNKDCYLTKLRSAAIKQQKTDNFIKEVRQKYKLPIQGRSQRQILKSSHPRVQDKKVLEVDQISSILSKDIEVQDIGEPEDDFQVFQFTQVYPKKKQSQRQKKSKGKSKLKLISQSSQSEGEEKPKKSKSKSIQEERQQQIKQEKFENKEDYQMEKVQETHKRQSQVFSQESKQEKQKVLIIEDENYPFKQKMGEEQIYIGQCIVEGFSIVKRKLDELYTGCQIQTKSYIEPEKKVKKKNFGKKVERTMTMHICYQGKQIGRISDHEVRILLPLIDEGLIRVQFYVCNFPLFATQFKPILLKGKVFFRNKAITQPIVQSYEPEQKSKEKVHQLSALLTKINLQIKTHPLVKGKSQLIKKRQSKASIDLFNFQNEKQQNEKRQRLAKKAQSEMLRMKTDINFKQVQRSVFEMIGKKSEIESTSKKDKVTDEDFNRSEVKKKIIQIDTKAEKNKFSQLIDLNDENIEEAKPSSNFTSKLYHYQSLALGWMLKREGYLKQNNQNLQIHPLWTQYQLPQTPKYRLFFNELTGQLSVRRPLSKIKCKGGILADQMGLGKTVMMTSLIVTHPPPENPKKNFAKNLIILPLTLLSQWETELKHHTKGLKILIYYSTDRKKYLSTLNTFDVVLTTYGTISHQFSRGGHINKTGIYRYSWHRIILDEAHYIKGRIIQTSKAVYQLQANHRWCLTGTPIQNHLGDLFSLIHFIKYTPWSEIACWNRFLAKPLEDGDQAIYGVLRTILKKIFLRRTKNSKDEEGKSIIDLPTRVSKIELLTMTESEREFYNTVHKANELQINALLEKGLLEAKYMQVFEMLMRLRQICCHQILFKSVPNFVNDSQFEDKLKKFVQKAQNRLKNSINDQEEYFQPIINEQNQQIRVRVGSEIQKVSQSYLQQTLQKIKSKKLDCCLICLNEPEDPVVTSCLHIFCKSCTIRQIQENGFCASCRRTITKQDFMHLPRQNRLNISEKKQVIPSTKMVAFMEHIRQLKKQDKVVVFSQFLGMLDLLEGCLKKQSVSYVRMQGSNTHKERTRIVKSFQEDPKIQIFLVSLKTAGVGLNLVAANKVFLMDPWWNPAVQEQAIERVHRIGQKREVEIIRFIIERTIEMRMLQLNTEKKMMSQNVLMHTNEDKVGGVSAKIQKLKYMMENY